MKKLIRSVSENKETLSLLAGCCIFLSLIEYIIPKPVPFMRLGIANIPIMISLIIFNPALTFILVLLKIAGQGIITGTLFSYVFIFSLCGSLAGGSAMIIAGKFYGKNLSMTGISVLGALSSNLAQLAAARLLIFGESAIMIAPPVILAGTVSGEIIGLFADSFVSSSRWLAGKISGGKP